MNKLKRKSSSAIFLYIFLLGLIMFSIFVFVSYENYKNRMGTKFTQLSKSINHIIISEEQRIIKLYNSRLIKNIKTPGVIEAIRNNDKEKLYKLIEPRYNELKKENPNFINMHFHTKNNHSFLRMHKKNKSGDDLSSFRKIVVDVNKQKRSLYGFENGKFGYFYRIIIPVLDKNEHIGSVEFGLTLNYFIENLKRLIPNTKFGLLFLDSKQNKLIADEDDFFKNSLKQLKSTKEYHTVQKNKKLFLLSDKITIKDYNGKDAIKILFAQDVTEYKKEFINDFLFLLFLGGFTYTISFIIINTAFKEYIRSIKQQSKKLEEYNNIIDKYVIVSSTDLNGNITYASSAFCKISGYSKDELEGKPHNLIRHPDMSSSTFANMWKTIKNQMIWKGEVKNLKKNGDYYWVKAIISPIYDENGDTKGYTAIRNDITSKKLIEEISQKDKLTQIYNRLKLDETLELEIARANRYGMNFSIILLDIDKFKSVNDTYGHQAGDSVLVQMAQILSKNIRNTDLVGRWGGEEFLIICPNTTGNQCKILAENLRKKIENFEFDIVKNITSSFGVSEYIFKEKDSNLLKRCDDALYEAKKSGRNQVLLK